MNSAVFIIGLLKCSGIGATTALKYIIRNDFSLEKCISNITSIVSRQEYDFCIKEAIREIKMNYAKGIKIATIFDKNYPKKLCTISDPVLYLYYQGDINLLNKEAIGVIGTRHPSNESIQSTEIICKKIIEKKYVIVGGLALGIDTVGHKTAAYNKGKTIAVLPTAIDNIQPSSNKLLAKQIVATGGLLISEYPTESRASKFNYPKRDRIQAAISDILIVPEANEESGTMITVTKAIKEGKVVFQLSTNKNKKIENKISLDDDFIQIFSSIIEKNKMLKKDDIKKENEQMSLF